MAEVVLFHHVQGLTDGVRAFAGELSAGGHTVHTPDLFDGQRPATIDDGIALVQSIGDEVLTERADQAVAGLPEGLVYAGFSFGGATAQRFAQTRSERHQPEWEGNGQTTPRAPDASAQAFGMC